MQSSPHIGHLRSALVYDLWRRWLTHSGYDVTLVRNVTDIDDKILNAAESTGDPERWWALAYRVELEFTAGYNALGILPPTYEPRATAYIAEMRDIIQRLIDGGHAYAAAGDVYFDTASWPTYGELTRQKPENMEAAADADPRGKRDPRDFAMWKGTQARRARVGELAEPVGTGTTGMAHRVLRDVAPVSGRGLRHPRRRTRPALPAPRERARAVHRCGRPVRHVLAAQRARERQRPEDVEVARQLGVRRRVARADPADRAALLPRQRPLPLDDRLHRRVAGRGRGVVRAHRDVPHPCRAGARRTAGSLGARPARRVRRGDG